MSADAVMYFFMFTLKKYLMLKIFFLKFNVLYALKTHFNCFNSHVNNLDNDMERTQLFFN